MLLKTFATVQGNGIGPETGIERQNANESAIYVNER